MLVGSAPGPEEGMHDLELAAWRCLRSLCHNLSTRLKYHHDPDFFCTKTGDVLHGFSIVKLVLENRIGIKLNPEIEKQVWESAR